MSKALDDLTAQVSKVEVSASNVATQFESLKAEISVLTTGQEDPVKLAALTARLAVVQAGLDALGSVAAPAPDAPPVAG